jgi:SpoVK/Ycf46/Vps4 family AAA+-type ATPase
MRLAIQTAEAVGSCVLWIDEMEKAFAGMGGSGSTDGGTSQRVFGNFITWMQEKTTPCFIISTVNRIEALPPELLRKGRFDETFFVGLPSDEERETIIGIHIQKYGRKLEDFDTKTLAKCVKLSKGFSGAELEEAVVSGLYVAFHQNRELTADDILKAIQETNPLSKSKKDELDHMAKWAASNALNASKVSESTKEEQQAGRQLEI